MSNNEINVLNIGLSHVLGGTESFVKSMYEVLSRESVRFYFLNTEINGMMYEDYYKSMGVHVYDVGYKYKDIRKFLKNNKFFDYILVHMNYVSKLYYLRFIRNKKTKIIAISHVAMVDLPKSIKGYIKRIVYCFRRFSYNFLIDKKIAVSKEAGQYVFGKNSKVQIIENFIDTQRYCFDLKARNAIRKRLKISNDTVVIGHVGRMAQVKNHSLLLDIFKKYHDQNRNSFLLMIGDGALYSDVCTKIKMLGIDDCSKIISGENNPEKYYSAFDLFVFPSFHESFGRVVLEAQCAGLECLISDTIPKSVAKTDLVHFFNIQQPINEIVNNLVRIVPRSIHIRTQSSFELSNRQTIICRNSIFDRF